MNVTLLLSSLSFIAGGLLIAVHLLAPQRAPVAERLTTVRRSRPGSLNGGPARTTSSSLLIRLRAGYERDLRRSGGDKTLRRLLQEKLLVAFAAPFVLAAPYAAAVGRFPSPLLLVLLAVGGFFFSDLLLRHEIKQRQEQLFLDLPELISVLALALGAGQSLRRALELAARDCEGPLAIELERALSRARRHQDLSEREALVQVARETGEPSFTRFAELLAAKESPYLDFLRQQARETRAEQGRYLERAAERAYLAMHAPVAPLLAVLVLLLAYGFLHFLAQTT
ncbi:MAG: type II secretion system F family protein [Burkholderiales bacterium]